MGSRPCKIPPWSSAAGFSDLNGYNATLAGLNCAGSVALSSGTMNISPGNLYLDNTAGGSGGYNLSGTAMLFAQNQYVGYSGAPSTPGLGAFTQSGGTNNVGNDLYLGTNAGSSGTYNLSGSGLLSRRQ